MFTMWYFAMTLQYWFIQYQIDGFIIIASTMGESDQTLNAPMVVIGMVNGMIGGLILILPVYALDAGYILSFIILSVTGLFSFYSAYLCVIHMGDQPDLDYAILRHFNGNKRIKILYDICVWSNLILVDMLYFELIMLQWNGIIGATNEEYPIFNPIVNAVVLFILVFVLKYFQFGASVMAYGIISIIAYILFLVWVMVTSDQGNNAVEYTAFGSKAITLAAAMGQAYSIQSFFIPVLKKNPNPQRYMLYTMLAYIIGGSVYFYIAYMGSFGVLHRFIETTPKGNQQVTIENYFKASDWEVKIIEVIYLIHLYSVFPEFMLISKKRLFGVLGIKQSNMGNVSSAEIIYICICIAVCLTIGIRGVSVTDIIDINGAVIGFFFIYFLPALLHIKCMYFSKGKRQIPPNLSITFQETPSNQEQKLYIEQRKQSEIEIQTKIPERKIESDKEELNKSLLEAEENGTERNAQQLSVPKMQLSNVQIQNSYYYCDCGKDESWKKYSIINIVMIVVMVLMGAFIMVNGIWSVATN